MNFSSSVLICPVCGRPLRSDDKEAYCENNHRFDRAKQGYLNLLRSQSSGAAHHGDDRLMLTERRSFLEKGYYHPMRQKMAELAVEYFPAGKPDLLPVSVDSALLFSERTSYPGRAPCPECGSLSGCKPDSDQSVSAGSTPVILDCGCGEGYYSRYLYEGLASSGKPAAMLCLDISREAAKLTARKDFPHETVVASAYELPVLSESCAMITDIFAPVAEKEFSRVLSPDGILLRVVPEEMHLWELKQAVYDIPYKNPPVDPELEGFTFIRSESVRYTIHLDNAADIQSLFKMTPYYYKTSRSDQARLAELTELTTQLSFAILISRKRGERL